MVKYLFTKYNLGTIILLIIISFANLRVNAQVNSAQQQNRQQKFNPLTSNVEDVIPPLSVLLDSAVVHAAQVNYEGLHAMRNRYEIKRARLEWTQYFGANIDGSWGNWINSDTYLKDYTPNSTVLTPPNVRSLRWDYALSVWMRFPLSSILKRPNEIMIGKKEVEMSLALRDQRANEARLEVIREYNAMLLAQARMKISNDYQEYTRIQMQMADLQFQNKEIEISEYARLKEIQIRGANDYEQYKSEFSMNYQLLEEMTGMKFNLINELK
jgi:outer membrane protein TolC